MTDVKRHLNQGRYPDKPASTLQGPGPARCPVFQHSLKSVKCFKHPSGTSHLLCGSHFPRQVISVKVGRVKRSLTPCFSQIFFELWHIKQHPLFGWIVTISHLPAASLKFCSALASCSVHVCVSGSSKMRPYP